MLQFFFYFSFLFIPEYSYKLVVRKLELYARNPSLVKQIVGVSCP